MTRITRHLSYAAVFMLASLATAYAAETSPASPNIVVFLVDDMGVMDTSVPFLTDESGKPKRYPLNDYYRTPNMERLAERGIRFNNFYAMSVCSPTRVSILTGQNAARHHTTNWINPDRDNRGPFGPPQWNWTGLKKDDVTLPRLLQAAGYETIHVGKAHFGPREFAGAEPKNLGFDINVAGCSIGAPGSYYGEKNYSRGPKRPGSDVPHLKKYHGTETFLTEALTIEAKSHVTEAVEANKPFFLYLAHYAVHAPFHSRSAFRPPTTSTRANRPRPQAFATLIEGMDKSLGDILDHLDALGVSENTLILFLGDNGSDAPLGHQHEVACAVPAPWQERRPLRGRHARAFHRRLGKIWGQSLSETSRHPRGRPPEPAGCRVRLACSNDPWSHRRPNAGEPDRRWIAAGQTAYRQA